MSEVFLKVLNMSIAASWLILAVILLRFVFKRVPKWIVVLLWGIVALRLVLPFSFESVLSLVPSAETFSAHNIQFDTPAISSGIPAVNSVVNPVLGEAFPPNDSGSVNPFYVWMFIVSVIWFIGIVVMLLYAVTSYVRVHHSVSERVPYEGNIFLCDYVKSPFILGLVKPKIYLPSNMDAMAMEPVIAHEKAHLARRDHWWKPLGFLILTVHWFNPLCWIAYVLLCRDIELACDEKVIRQMDLDEKKQYSTALLECSTGRRLVTICPLAFGEVGVKERVKNVLNYKKPAFWIIIAAAVTCVLVTVCFATNPVPSKNYISLESTHFSPPSAFYSLDLTENVHGTVIAERWENGRCISTNPVFMNNLTQQIQLYLDPQENGVNVQLGVDNGDTIFEIFSYPEGKGPDGWAWDFASLDEGEKKPLQLGEDQIIAAMALDFGYGVRSYSCDTLTADKKQVEDAEYLIVIRAFLADAADSIMPNEQHTVQARITEVEDKSFLVTPVEGSWELSSSDLFRVPVTNMPSSPEPQVGDIVEITHDGYILETYPAQFGTIYSMRVISQENPPEIDELRAKFPEYFELGTFKGLEVYVWQMTENDYRFGLMQGTNREKTLEELIALKDATAEEMALILSTFDIEDKNIFVIPWQNPISSYAVTEDMAKDPEYINNIRSMLGLDAVSTSSAGGTDTPAGPDAAATTLSGEQTAIRQAIMEHNRSADTTGVVPCASFVELACIVADGSDFSQYTHYGWALYEEYKATDGGFEAVSGSHVPVTITLREDQSGIFTLEEYWEPRDGSYYVQDIREKFPADIAEDGIDSQKFILQQKQECYSEAAALTGLDTDKVIQTLIETVCSSPALSSNPEDYIDEHSIEYRELTYYGRHTLKYCFTRFKSGGETGLDGQIMMRLCQEIAAGWGEDLLVFSPPDNGTLTGQVWYSTFKINALSLISHYTEIELAERYPASYLLLSILGKV